MVLTIYAGCVWGTDAVTFVMFKSWSKVPTIETMWGLGASLLWFLMDDGAGARWSQRVLLNFKKPSSWAWAERHGSRKNL